MSKHSEIRLLDRALLTRAAADSFRKLHPRHMARNPVMFVVEAGAVLATLALLGVGTRVLLLSAPGRPLALGDGPLRELRQQAEGRGKAQADALRRTN